MAYPSKSDITGKTSSVPLYFPNYKGESLSIRLPNGKLFPGWVKAEHAKILLNRGEISKKEYTRAYKNRWDTIDAHGPEDLKKVFWQDADILKALKTELTIVAANAPSDALLSFEEKRRAYGGITKEEASGADTYYEDYKKELEESIAIVEARLKKPEFFTDEEGLRLRSSGLSMYGDTAQPRLEGPGNWDPTITEVDYEDTKGRYGYGQESGEVPEGRARTLARQNFAEELKNRMGAMLAGEQGAQDSDLANLIRSTDWGRRHIEGNRYTGASTDDFLDEGGTVTNGKPIPEYAVSSRDFKGESYGLPSVDPTQIPAESPSLLGESEKTRAAQLGLSQEQVTGFLRRELAGSIKDNLKGDRDFYKKGANLGILNRTTDVGSGLGIGGVGIESFGVSGLDPQVNRGDTRRAVEKVIGRTEANLAKDDAGYGFPSPEKFAEQSAERQRMHDERMKDSRNLLTGEKSALDYLERNKNVANQAPLGSDTIMGRSRAKREVEAQKRKEEKEQRKATVNRAKQIARARKDGGAPQGNPLGALSMTAG